MNNTSDLKYFWNTSDTKESIALTLPEGSYKCVVQNNAGESSVVFLDVARDPTLCDVQTRFKLNNSQIVSHNLSNGIASFRYNNGGYHKDKVHWSFGNGMPSSFQEVTIHQFARNGIYKVCLMTGNQFGADTLCKEIEINSVKLKGEKSVSHRSILNYNLAEWSNQISFTTECNGKLYYGKNLTDGNYELW